MPPEEKQPKFKQEIPDRERPAKAPEEREQQEFIDELQGYVPDLVTIRHKEVAQKLVTTVEGAALEIEEELELAKKKLEYLLTLDIRTRLSESGSSGVLDFDDLEKQLLFLADIYDSKNPYQALLTKLPQDKLQELQEQNPDLQIYQSEFSTGRQLTSLVWKRDEHQRKVNRAEKLAKNLIVEQVVNLLDGIQAQIKQMENDLYTRGERPEELYRKYCLADKDSAEAVSKQLEDKLSSYRSIIAGLPKMEKFISFLQVFGSRCEGKFDWKVNSVVYGVAEFKKGLSSISDSLDKERKFSSPSSRLNSTAEQKKLKIRLLFEEPNPHGGS